MRLTDATKEIIKTEIYNILGKDSHITLFGSRISDEEKGGDIDLFIQTPKHLKNRIATECKLTARLYIKLGGRKVDVLIKDPLSKVKPIYQHALDYGVAL
jgi:predicted nucleotidyltransferase